MEKSGAKARYAIIILTDRSLKLKKTVDVFMVIPPTTSLYSGRIAALNESFGDLFLMPDMKNIEELGKFISNLKSSSLSLPEDFMRELIEKFTDLAFAQSGLGPKASMTPQMLTKLCQNHRLSYHVIYNEMPYTKEDIVRLIMGLNYSSDPRRSNNSENDIDETMQDSTTDEAIPDNPEVEAWVRAQSFEFDAGMAKRKLDELKDLTGKSIGEIYNEIDTIFKKGTFSKYIDASSLQYFYFADSHGRSGVVTNYIDNRYDISDRYHDLFKVRGMSLRFAIEYWLKNRDASRP